MKVIKWNQDFNSIFEQPSVSSFFFFFGYMPFFFRMLFLLLESSCIVHSTSVISIVGVLMACIAADVMLVCILEQ